MANTMRKHISMTIRYGKGEVVFGQKPLPANLTMEVAVKRSDLSLSWVPRVMRDMADMCAERQAIELEVLLRRTELEAHAIVNSGSKP